MSRKNYSFPIKKRVQITFEMDLDWNDSLASKPDHQLKKKRKQLINSSLLINKLFGIVALRQLHEYLAQIDIEDKFLDFDEEDLIWAANFKHMTNKAIFEELMFMKMGYADESLLMIASMDAFSTNVNKLSIVDSQTGEKIDMGPIPNPMILERGTNYIIGQGNEELMLIVSSVLENEDITDIIDLCQDTIFQSQVKSNRKLSRMGILITTALQDTEHIKEALTIFCQALIPQANLHIQINKVDKIIRLDEITALWG